MVSLAGERVMRMRVDPLAPRTPVSVKPGERLPFATVDLESLRSLRGVGVTPE
jgi:hypothetical protein